MAVPTITPTPTMTTALRDPLVRYFCKAILTAGLQHDPVDVIQDLELCLKLYKEMTDNANRNT